MILDKSNNHLESNGCGKSTSAEGHTHIIPHQLDSVLLDGKDISKEDTKALAKNGHTGTSDYKYF